MGIQEEDEKGVWAEKVFEEIWLKILQIWQKIYKPTDSRLVDLKQDKPREIHTKTHSPISEIG